MAGIMMNSIALRIAAEHTELLEQILHVAEQHKIKIYIVGGVVRDLILDLAIEEFDFDFAIEGNAHDFVIILNKHISGELVLHKRFYTATLRLESPVAGVSELDFATTQTETYKQPGALPDIRLASLKKTCRGAILVSMQWHFLFVNCFLLVRATHLIKLSL